MATKEPKKQNTVLWWIGWILLTIVSFFVSCYFWTGFIASRVGPMSQGGVPLLWVTAVFGTWLAMLLPLIIVMYNKVDRAYEDKRMALEAGEWEKAAKALGVRSISIPEKDRILPKNLSNPLKKVPTTIKRGHLVNAILKNGRRVENVFILDRHEVLGIYNATDFSFKIEEVAALEPVMPENLTVFEAKKWLRLDGEEEGKTT